MLTVDWAGVKEPLGEHYESSVPSTIWSQMGICPVVYSLPNRKEGFSKDG
jgi:hypothetical protein